MRWKGCEKKAKKHLTNAAGCGKITNVPPKRRVPCKLNNVTNEKHQNRAALGGTDKENRIRGWSIDPEEGKLRESFGKVI